MGIEVFPIPASGPSLAEITSAITSNAAPATVTMPAITSSITTNAASSGVTMAAITSAITTNAASSGVTMAAITSAITTNAASSGVTLAAIGTQVANNASPYGGTPANVGVHSASGSNGVTFSGLSGYKHYRIMYIVGSPSLSCNLLVRLNGDTGANYAYFNSQGGNTQTSNDSFVVTGTSGSARGGFIEIPFANSTSVEKGMYQYVSQIAGTYNSAGGVWKNSAAITSITMTLSGGGTADWYVRLIGVN